MVMIPLETWNASNGFFVAEAQMLAGQDMCVDGRETLIFPGTGGALVIVFHLAL